MPPPPALLAAGDIEVLEVEDWFRPAAARRRRASWRPGLRASDLLPAGWDPELTAVVVEGRRLLAGEPDALQPGQRVALVRTPGVQTAFVVVGSTVANLAFRRIVNRLLYPPFPNLRTPNEDASTIYGWSGIGTNYNANGLTLPVILGEHRTGGQAIALFTDIVDGDPPEAYLYVLIALSAGPVEAIGDQTQDADELTLESLPAGLLINDNAGANFSAVTAYVRMGTLTQEPIPGFNIVATQYQVGLAIDQVTDSSGDPPVIDFSMAATWDMPLGQVGDRIKIGLLFPNGLYRIANDGKVKPLSVDFQVRYQELDDLGNPIGTAVITTGSDVFTVTAKQLSAFTQQIEVPFYSSDTFLPPTPTGALRFTKGSKHYGALPSVALDVPSWALPGTPLDEISVVQACQLREIKDHNPLWHWADWDEDETDPRVEGLMIDARMVDTETAALEVTWGEGTGAGDATERVLVGEISIDAPFLWAVTWRRNAFAGQHRLRVYLNGAMLLETFTTTDLLNPGGNLVWNTLPNKETAGTGKWHGQVDHDAFRLYDAELTPQRIAALHNSGAWQINTSGETDLVAGWQMDDATGGITLNYFPGPSSLPIAIVPSAPATVAGFVANLGAGSIQRARYRIDVQRTSPVKESLSKHDTVEFDHAVVIVDEELAYPGVALLGLRILANDQLNGQPPNVTVPVKGVRECPVWDGVDPDNPSFSLQWTANPAWQLAFLALDEANGAGHLYDVGDIDWPSFKVWADACDVPVYDQKGRWGGAYTPTTPLKLGYAASGTGLDGEVYKVELPKPIPSHLVVGHQVRLTDLTDPSPSGEYSQGVFTIRNVVSISATTYELWLNWPTGLAVPSTNPLTDTSAVLYGVEPRLQADLVLGDRGTPFLEARAMLAAIGRAQVVTLGDKLRVVFDGPRQPVAAFNPANIIAGTFRISSTRREERFNSGVAEFQDRDQDYQRNVVQRDHQSLQDASSTVSVRRKGFDFRGVTRRSQALRELALLLNRNYLIQLSCEFEGALDSVFVEPGDVIVVAHPLPRWAVGGRLPKDTTQTGNLVTVDISFVLGQKNLFGWSTDLTNAAWEKAGTTPPTVDPTPVAGPDPAENTAWKVTFAPGSNNRLRQGQPHRGNGTQYTLIAWARLVSGTADALLMGIVTENQSLIESAPTLTSSFARYVVTGTSTQPIGTDPTVFGRLKIDPGEGGSVVVEVDRMRLIVGADDGLDAVGDEATEALLSYTMTIRNPENDDEIITRPVAAQSGEYQPGDQVLLSTGIGFVAKREWLWILGVEEYGSKLFEVVGVGPGQDFRNRLELVEYDEAVYPDEDAFGDLPTQAEGGALSSQQFSVGRLPGLPTGLSVTEEAARDQVTGQLSKALVVAWAPDKETASLIDRSLVWLRDGSGGPWEVVGEVPGARAAHRIPGASLEAGETYTAAVQPVTRSGLRTPLAYTRQATVPYLGLFPGPPEPVAARAALAGDAATYEVDLPDDFQDAVVEVFRGGTFLGQPVGRIPVGGRELGPTADWCVLPAAADGRGSPPLYFRLATANGARGQFLQLAVELDPVGFGAVLLEDSMEDGPWDTAGAGFSETPVLTELEMEASGVPGQPDRLHFDPMSSALEGTYQSTEYALGRPRHVHVSAGLFGNQVPPYTVGGIREIGRLDERSLSLEGYLDPGHPDYGAVECHLEWAHSLTADPGTDYEPFRCGPAYLRSCRFRIRLVRPDATWDGWVTRAGCSIRPMPLNDPDDFDGGGIV